MRKFILIIFLLQVGAVVLTPIANAQSACDPNVRQCR